MEKSVQFENGQQTLSGRIYMAHSEYGAVITHPHPLYGGNMNNPVVEAVASAYKKRGYTTLAFDFRGVGDSQGQWDEGIGEQEDAIAAVNFLVEKGISRIDLAGYSFGAWINAHIGKRIEGLNRMVMVSPPVQVMAFAEDLFIPELSLIITGSRDDVAPAADVERLITAWNPEARLEILDGADHFYMGSFQTVADIVYKAIPEAVQADDGSR